MRLRGIILWVISQQGTSLYKDPENDTSEITAISLRGLCVD